MKIITILGTRPEIIRLSLIIKKLDQLCDHVLVHTGQNFDPTVSDIFFEELEVRKPDHCFGAKGTTFGEQVGIIIHSAEQVLLKEKPDRLLILGDTNSALSAIAAKRLGIPVYHMEAGNRCYDDRVPEEVNRRIIDHCSDILMPYTERSRMNLLREGIACERIFVTGNPILEVLNHYDAQIEASSKLAQLNLKPKNFFLVTLHRAENVDGLERLSKFLEGLDRLGREYQVPVICSLHPRTKSKIAKHKLDMNLGNIKPIEPLGLFDFVRLEKNALCVLSDSGTVQEECCLFKVPSVTLRDVTERPETIESGSNILSGAEPDDLVQCVKKALHEEPQWQPPPEYLNNHVSSTVLNILLGFNLLKQHLIDDMGGNQYS